MSTPKDVRQALLGSQLARANSAAASPPSHAELPRSTRVSSGAVGAVSRSLTQFEQELQAAKELANAADRIAELDPALIDPSFIRDRLAVDEEAQRQLVEAIRDQGQQIPILVRPSLVTPGRYQLAFGHRRLRACQDLGVMVKAIVRNLSDVELVVAQGQENTARRDLTFIEKALFARRMEERGFGRESVMAALTTDKTELSKLHSVIRSIETDIIEAIGSPKAGRPRWLGLAQRLAEKNALDRVRRLLADPQFSSLQSDERFNAAFAAASATPKRSDTKKAWLTPDGKKVVQIQRSARKLTLEIDSRAEPEFGDFLISQLSTIYGAYKAR